MADLSKINLDGTTYSIKDTTARNKLGIPAGGTAGQVLVKNSATDGDASWCNPGMFPVYTKWYHPTGVAVGDIVAAYQFVGAETEALALSNVNDTTYNTYALVKSATAPTWEKEFGFYFPAGTYLKTDCDNGEFRTAAFPYEEGAMWSGGTDSMVYSEPNIEIRSVVFGYRYDESPASSKCSVGSVVNNNMLYTRTWQGSTTYITYHTAGYLNSNYYFYKSATEYNRGVLGCNFNSGIDYSIYINGMNLSLTTHTAKITVGNHGIMVIGQNPNRTAANTIPAYVTAIAFYRVALTKAQHMELYNNIVALGGGLD